MKGKAGLKWTMDILMTIALLFLIGYQFWGEKAHEWIGAGMLLLFLAHQICNWNWYQKLFQGPYTPMRIAQLVINSLTLAAMLMLLYSGITMSRYVFAFLPGSGGMALARRLHILGSYWGYLLMGLHLGLHWSMILNRLHMPAGKGGKITGFIMGLLVAGYGLYVFIQREFLTYMLLRSEFVFLDYEESRLLFILDHLALLGLCIVLAHYGSRFLKNAGRRSKKEAVD